VGPEDHVSDCYFCLTHVSDHRSKTKRSLCYLNLLSAWR